MMSLCTIVGAGVGLGASLTRKFAREGYRVAIMGRRPEVLDSILNNNETRHDGCRGFHVDAAQSRSIANAFREIKAWAGATDVLIYNAARLEPSPASTLTANRMATDMAVNLGGALSAVQQVLPAMRERHRGTILMTGGSLALDPIPEWAALSASKAALRSFSIALAKEVRADGIHVAIVEICGRIEPGGFFDPDRIADTYWSLHTEHIDVAQREVIYQPGPLGACGRDQTNQ
jgi:short-subunit dehydrogenase